MHDPLPRRLRPSSSLDGTLGARRRRGVGALVAGVTAMLVWLVLTSGGALADPLPPQIHTVAGGGTCSLSQIISGGTCDDVSATSTSIGAPRSVSALPGGGYLYVDQAEDLVREVEPSGKVITVAGTAIYNVSAKTYAPDTTDTDGVPATQSGLDDPVSVSALPDGGFLITEFAGDRVRMVSPGPPGEATITTVAGIPPTQSSSAPTSGDGCAVTPQGGSYCGGTQEELNYPSDAEPTAAGGVLIADTYNDRILLLSSIALGATIESVAGGGSCDDSSTTTSCEGLPASQVALDLPAAVSELPGDPGSYLIAEYGADAVREVSQEASTGTFTTVAGEPGSPGFSGDGGPATAAQLSAPEGVTALSGGGFLIADSGNEVIRQVSPSGVISTLAGTADAPDYTGDGGDATAATLANPTEVAPTSNGGFLIADEDNGAIREITQPPVSTFTLSPGLPNGLNGWYITDPGLTVTSTEKATTQCELDPAQPPPAYGAIVTGCPYTGSTAGSAVLGDGVHTVWAAGQNSFGDQQNPVSFSFKVDATPPPITCSSFIQDIQYGSSTPVTATLSDSLAGPAALPLSAAVNTATLGLQYVNLTGTNNAGKSNTVECDYDVVPRSFNPLPSVQTPSATVSPVNVRSLAVVNVPTYATVYVSCHGRGCPFGNRRKVNTVAVRGKRGPARAQIGPLFAHATLSAGAHVAVSVVAPGTVGTYVNLKVGKNRRATPHTVCLPVGALAPDGHSC